MTADKPAGSFHKGLRTLAFLGLMLVSLTLIILFVQSRPVGAPPRPALAAGDRVLVQPKTTFSVDLDGLAAWNRAYAAGDTREMSYVMAKYETFGTPEPARARVTARSGDAVQLEFFEGANAGRRGWTNIAWLSVP